jgi:hypothetical protein
MQVVANLLILIILFPISKRQTLPLGSIPLRRRSRMDLDEVRR